MFRKLVKDWSQSSAKSLNEQFAVITIFFIIKNSSFSSQMLRQMFKDWSQSSVKINYIVL